MRLPYAAPIDGSKLHALTGGRLHGLCGASGLGAAARKASKWSSAPLIRRSIKARLLGSVSTRMPTLSDEERRLRPSTATLGSGTRPAVWQDAPLDTPQKDRPRWPASSDSNGRYRANSARSLPHMSVGYGLRTELVPALLSIILRLIRNSLQVVGNPRGRLYTRFCGSHFDRDMNCTSKQPMETNPVR